MTFKKYHDLSKFQNISKIKKEISQYLQNLEKRGKNEIFKIENRKSSNISKLKMEISQYLAIAPHTYTGPILPSPPE